MSATPGAEPIDCSCPQRQGHQQPLVVRRICTLNSIRYSLFCRVSYYLLASTPKLGVRVLASKLDSQEVEHELIGKFGI